MNASWTNDDYFRTFDVPRLHKLQGMPLSLPAVLSIVPITVGLALLLWRVVRKMARYIEERARNAERERIAREIHDTLLQGVQSALFRLDNWSRDAAIPPLQRRGIGLVTTQLRSIVIEMRHRISELREMELQHCDFLERLQEFGQTESERDGIRFEIQVRGTCRTLTPNTQDQLLMVACEAIRNALKHAKPRLVLVEVTYEASGLSLEVIDDGTGIDERIAPGGRADGHFGLPGMRERVAQIGGDITIRGRAPIGTRLRVWIPATYAFGAAVVRLKEASKRA